MEISSQNYKLYQNVSLKSSTYKKNKDQNKLPNSKLWMEKECSFYYTHAFYYLFTNASHSFPFCKIILV